MALAGSEIDKLGERIRDAEGPPDEETLRQLQELVFSYVVPIGTVQRVLDGELGLEFTTRLKTVNTIVEKLRRPNPPRLSKMRDIAGARIVLKGGGLESQDMVVRLLEGSLRVKSKHDRRADPRSGYRAVHVVVDMDGYPVEIQVRTWMQDAWAQAYEKLADRLGRGIRYGEKPSDPVEARRVARMHALSDLIYGLERNQPEVLPLGVVEDADEEKGRIQQQFLELLKETKDLLRSMLE